MGVIIGFLSYLLLRICEKYEDCLKANINANPFIKVKKNQAEAWKIVNSNTKDGKKTFGFKPKVWISFTFPLILIFFLLGIYFIHIGNGLNDIQEKIEKKQFQDNLDHKYDSLTKDIKLVEINLDAIAYQLRQKKINDSLLTGNKTTRRYR